MDYDVIIIGSGAGGAPVANTLVNAGKSVLIIEKGPLFEPQSEKQNGTKLSQKRSDFKRDEMLAYGPEHIINVDGAANNGKNYFSSHIEPDINDEPHVYLNKNNQDWATIEGYTAQAVGGGTQLYGGVSLRFTHLDFNLATFNAGRKIKDDPNGDVEREARNWPISYDAFIPYYNKAEKLVGINGTRSGQLKDFSNLEDVYQRPLTPNPISDIAKKGMVYLGKQFKNDNKNVKPYRTPLAVITSDHKPSARKTPKNKESFKSAYINRYGDPLGLKSNTWVSLLKPISDKPNFSLYANCTVTHLAEENSKITKVHYMLPDGSQTSSTAKIVVVACSAIESIRLLKISGMQAVNFDRKINHNDYLGKYFLTHCFGGANGFTKDRYDKSISLDSDWATDCCATEAFANQTELWAGGAIYNNTSDQALPISFFRSMGAMDLDNLWDDFESKIDLVNDALISEITNKYGKNLSISFMANQVPQKSNRIELHKIIKDKWRRPAAYIIKNWHSHDKYLMSKFAEQCETILLNGGSKMDSSGKYVISKGGVHTSPNPRARIANHVLGGIRFGDNPEDSVLDKNCRLWQFDNLYVTDGGFMPTSGSANPTLTIQANAFRVADEILKDL